MAERDQRTERATPRRREKERREGNVPTSREINSLAVLVAGLGALFMVFENAGRLFLQTTKSVFGGLDELLLTGCDQWTEPMMRSAALFFVPVAVAGLAGALFSGFSQTRMLFTTKPLVPDLKRLNPLPKLKTIFFSKEAVVMLLQSLAKIGIIGGLTTYVIWSEVDNFGMLASLSKYEILAYLGEVATRLVLMVVALFVVFSVIDWIIVKQRYEKKIKMSKQEVRTEHRDQEGDPMIKGKRRFKQKELIRSRMASNVSNADVVLVNPTHYAVALRYDVTCMSAPKLTAKGEGDVAASIRDIARAHGVPIVHNPPLTRALFSAVKTGAEIPTAFYGAVAEVLAFVYRAVRGRRNRFNGLSHSKNDTRKKRRLA
ncbi:MAG: EscU/YscU/HrcU family type III secretion system export apparatus switch protein [Pseudomonadota bacterium]